MPLEREAMKKYALAYRKSPHGKKTRARARYAAELKMRYGLSVEDVARAFESQGGKCAIAECGKGLFFGRETQVDHCHATGVFRGLLCLGCNTALGHVRDRIPHLLALATYLADR